MAEPLLGSIYNAAFSFAPRGYNTCDGQLLAVNQNTALFSLLGVQYGGNGQQTFGLPQLQGRVQVSMGQSPGNSNYVMGQTGGSESTTMLQSNLPPHNHPATFTNASTLNATNTRGTTATPTAGAMLARGTDGAMEPDLIPFIYVPASSTNAVALGGLTNVAGTVTNGVTGNGVPFSNIKPYNTIITIIAVQGVYPSRN